MKREPGVAGAECYGKNGQLQRGIDIIITRETGGVDVAQCKNHVEYGDDKLVKACHSHPID